MNAFTRTRQTAVAVGIGVLLLVGSVGVGALNAGPSSPVRPTIASVADGGVATQNQSEDNASAVPPNRTTEAMRAVENRTNGTVVGAQLRGEGSGELQRSTFVYELDVLAANGTLLTAEVYAENATVIGVETANQSGVLGDLFGSDDGVPDAARNASSLRSAAEVVGLAVNETDSARTNETVTEVELGTRNGSLVYTVTLLSPGGEPREIVVAARRGTGGVVTTDPQNHRSRSPSR